MTRYLALIFLALLTACGHGGDETLTAYGTQGRVFRLIEIDGVAFPGQASLSFPSAGRISGQAPCNSFSGNVPVPYPWFGTDRMIVTRTACPDLPLEDTFFANLEAMTVVEISGAFLLLSAPGTGRTMLFQGD